MIIKNKADEIQCYLVDSSNYKGQCEAVYFPECAEDVVSIIKQAAANKTTVTIAGNGTGLTGARVPQGGIVIATDKLNKIIEINKEEHYAIVEPGVLLSDFLKKTSDIGLLYPPDPTEKNCFIGGTIATNASGAKTFKYGSTRNFILELEVVLPDGDIVNLKRGENVAHVNKAKVVTRSGREIICTVPDYHMPETKNASGYFCKLGMDIIDLFIGSEGTLGVITKAKLKLLDKPDKVISCVVFFNSEEDGLLFVRRARELSYNSRKLNLTDEIDALALEFFDSNSLRFLSDEYPQINPAANSAVWFEQECSSVSEDKLVEKWNILIEECVGDLNPAWFAFTASDKEKIEQFRHALAWKVNDYIARNNFKKLGTDVAVPDSKFEELYYHSRRLVQESGLNFVSYGHFGNSHMHLNMLPKNQEEYFMGCSIYRMICEAAVNYGGTISAEHGVGKIKTEYLKLMYGEENIKKMMSIKTKLDPYWLLGRGNIFQYEQSDIP